MIRIEEDLISKRLGRIRRKERWNRGKREENHHF
jgi:hypothetical protein